MGSFYSSIICNFCGFLFFLILIFLSLYLRNLKIRNSSGKLRTCRFQNSPWNCPRCVGVIEEIQNYPLFWKHGVGFCLQIKYTWLIEWSWFMIHLVKFSDSFVLLSKNRMPQTFSKPYHIWWAHKHKTMPIKRFNKFRGTDKSRNVWKINLITFSFLHAWPQLTVIEK